MTDTVQLCQAMKPVGDARGRRGAYANWARCDNRATALCTDPVIMAVCGIHASSRLSSVWSRNSDRALDPAIVPVHLLPALAAAYADRAANAREAAHRALASADHWDQMEMNANAWRLQRAGEGGS